jgi:hypothetical protein
MRRDGRVACSDSVLDDLPPLSWTPSQSAIGTPFGFLGFQSAWSREFSLSHLLEEIASPADYPGPPFDLPALLLGIGLIPCLWRRLPPALALYGTLSVVVPLSTGTALSFGRFLSVSFPHFLCLSSLVERRVATRTLLLAAFILGHCLIAKGLIAWRFVG